MSRFDDPLTRAALAVHTNKGAFALLLGSGVSRAAGIPTGYEITLHLIRQVAEAQGVDCLQDQDLERWYVETTSKKPNYSDLLKTLPGTESERRSILDHHIEPNEIDRGKERKIPTNAHKAIAKLVLNGYIKIIITTNFDRLIEHALQNVGIFPRIVDSIDSLNFITKPLFHERCFIFKIHGDYKDSPIRNTEKELCNYPQEYNEILDRIFSEYGLIICGWSADYDHGLWDAIQRVQNRRYSLFWASRKQLTDEDTVKNFLDSQKDVATQILIKSADTFFTELQNKIQAMEKDPNPPFVETLPARTNKDLAKPEHQTQLSDPTENEAERVIGSLGTAWKSFSEMIDFSELSAADITRCLAEGADPKVCDKNQCTPLHRAAIVSKTPDLVKALIDAGADLDAPDKYECTPLHEAAEDSTIPAVVEALIAAGADLNAKDWLGGTPLHRAASWGKTPAVVKALIAAGADLNAKDEYECTPLHRAARYSKVPEVVKALIDAGADLNAKDKYGDTPLHSAAEHRTTPDVVQFLIDAGADLKAQDKKGKTPLHSAAWFSKTPAVVKVLIDAGADLNAKDNDGHTPLYWAFRWIKTPAVIMALIGW